MKTEKCEREMNLIFQPVEAPKWPARGQLLSFIYVKHGFELDSPAVDRRQLVQWDGQTTAPCRVVSSLLLAKDETTKRKPHFGRTKGRVYEPSQDYC